MEILDRINSPEDVKRLDKSQLNVLCGEIREFIIDRVSKNGGHLAANLGIVEITVAVHRIFDTSKDRLVFDVGHQCYVHKILTGRQDGFEKLRQLGGVAGFPKPSESIHDAFIAGHASNSISVALGMARARTLSGENYDVIALIGDGALTGGLSYEGLSDAGESGEPLIVILNDNGMAITKNVGGIARHLAHLRLRRGYLSFKKWYRKLTAKVPGGKHIYRLTHKIKTAVKEAVLDCSMFEDMGFQYLGPVDGHDISRLTDVLTLAKSLACPVIVHAITTKGKGCEYAEENPGKYHGISQCDPDTGETLATGETFSHTFGVKLCEFAENDPKICAITAAMTSSTGLSRFSKIYPERFFDVGIAEGHGASMAAGAAKQGMIPVFAVYSTFLQRSFDMLLHDIGVEGVHVVFAVDRAGLVGDDGETHHGVFDVSYLTTVPNMTVLAPASFAELSEMLEFALYKIEGPVAVRYPRGGEGRYVDGGIASSKCLREGSDITIVSYGFSINTALDAADILENAGVSAEIIKLDFVNPVDYKAVFKSAQKTGRLLVLEECVSANSVGRRIAARMMEKNIVIKSVILKDLGNRYITHGCADELRRMCGIDAESIASSVLKEINNEQNQA